MRALLLLLTACLAWLCPTVVAAAEWVPSADDKLLFELRSGVLRLGDGVRGYHRADDQCVVLADIVLALDLPIRVDRASGRVDGWVFAEDETLTVDVRAGTVAMGGRVRPLPAGTISSVPEGWCVGLEALGGWLGVALRPDLANASLHIETSRKLPFQLAAERRARAAAIRPNRSFDLATLPQSPTPCRAWRTPAVDLVASAGATRPPDGRTTGDLRYELFASGEIAGVSVDARLSSSRGGAPDRLRARAYRADPSGGLPLGATLIEAGDVAGVSSPLIVAGVQGRGVAITNRPLTQPDTFSTTSLVGDLPVGWEAELYRNDELIAFATPRDDGRYEFRSVPLRFGPNDFTVALYGPQGQVRRSTQRVRVGEASIPAERTWYWMSANDAGRDLVTGGSVSRETFAARLEGPRATLGFERGLSRRTSVFAYAHTLRADRGRGEVVEAGVRHSYGIALAQATAAWEFGGGLAGQLEVLGGTGRTSLSLRATTTGGVPSDRLARDARHEVVAVVDTVIGRDGGAIPLHGDVRWRVDRTGRSRLEAQARASVGIKRFYLTGEVAWNRSRTPGLGLVGPGVDLIGPRAATDALRQDTGALTVDGLSAALLASGSVGRVRVRTAARFSVHPDRRLDSLDASAEWSAGERGRWRVQASWQPGGAGDRSRGRIALGYSRRFDRFALGGRLEAATDGGLAAGIDLQLSLAPRQDGGLRISSERLASTGRAEVRVFRDTNGDGVRQPDEPLERDVQLVAGTARVDRLTYARGIAFVDGLVPNQPVLIGVDAGSLPDPLLIPAGLGRVVLPRAGIAATIDLPLSAAGVVEGTLETAAGSALGGVDLELVDPTGAVVATTLSEFDGYFVFDRAPYGHLTLWVAAPAASVIRVAVDTGVAVTLGSAQPIARLGTVVLRPASTAQTVALAGDSP